jgi:hypothetical protein
MPILITIYEDAGVEGKQILDVVPFDKWDDAMDFAYNNRWCPVMVTVTFQTLDNFHHTMPLTAFTQAEDYIK